MNNKIEIEIKDSFNLEDIFECGQCFRWNKENDSYIGVIKDAVVKVKKEKDKVTFEGTSVGNESFKDIIYEYFDLNTDYRELKDILRKVDSNMKEAISFGEGIRILNQDLWECIISFIISANNNIPRIKGIIERISKNYGRKIEFEGKEYYLFPTPDELSKASKEDLRALGTGFRDIRIYNTTKKIFDDKEYLSRIENLSSTDEMREELLKLDGVGPKVADCILLFSLKRFDVFPIDVWVRRVMNDLYIHAQDEDRINKKEILKIANDKFGSLSGLAQQYLFYWKREEN